MDKSSSDFLVAFDLDGTILQDEWAHTSSYQYLARKLGLNENIFGETAGSSLRSCWLEIAQKMGISVDVEQLANEHFQHTFDLIRAHHQEAAPGMETLLCKLKESGYTVAVTSSSDEWFVHSVIRFLKLESYIDFYVTYNQVEELKPAPDIYLAAQRIAGISAGQAVGVEDSVPGCTAVRRAGMVCIGFMDQGHNPQKLTSADYLVQSMLEIPNIVDALRYKGHAIGTI